MVLGLRSEKYASNIQKRGVVNANPPAKRTTAQKLGPVVIGFFLFVVVGSGAPGHLGASSRPRPRSRHSDFTNGRNGLQVMIRPGAWISRFDVPANVDLTSSEIRTSMPTVASPHSPGSTLPTSSLGGRASAPKTRRTAAARRVVAGLEPEGEVARQEEVACCVWRHPEGGRTASSNKARFRATRWERCCRSASTVARRRRRCSKQVGGRQNRKQG